jgi:hypothetical protein
MPCVCCAGGVFAEAFVGLADLGERAADGFADGEAGSFRVVGEAAGASADSGGGGEFADEPACPLRRRGPGSTVRSGMPHSSGETAGGYLRTAARRVAPSPVPHRCGTRRPAGHGRCSRTRSPRTPHPGTPDCPRRPLLPHARPAARTCRPTDGTRHSRRPPGCSTTPARTAARSRSGRPTPARSSARPPPSPCKGQVGHPDATAAGDRGCHVTDRLTHEPLQPRLLDLSHRVSSPSRGTTRRRRASGRPAPRRIRAQHAIHDFRGRHGAGCVASQPTPHTWHDDVARPKGRERLSF